MEFKGTKGKLQKVYITGVCIGIGVIQDEGYTEMTANSILPDVENFTDKQIKTEMKKIEADMTLYAHSKEMYDMLQKCYEYLLNNTSIQSDNIADAILDIIKRATNV